MCNEVRTQVRKNPERTNCQGVEYMGLPFYGYRNIRTSLSLEHTIYESQPLRLGLRVLRLDWLRLHNVFAQVWHTLHFIPHVFWEGVEVEGRKKREAMPCMTDTSVHN